MLALNAAARDTQLPAVPTAKGFVRQGTLVPEKGGHKWRKKHVLNLRKGSNVG